MFNKELFAKRFKELREKTNLNQRDCAEKLGISRGSISFYENGDRLPDIETIYNIADFFNVSADYLIGISNTPSKDVNIKNICDYTGLSEKSISKFCKYKDFSKIEIVEPQSKNKIDLFDWVISENNKNLLNFLFEDIEFFDLIYQISKHTNAYLEKEIFYHIDTESLDLNIANEVAKNELFFENSRLSDIEKLSLFNCQQSIINIIKRNADFTLEKYKNLIKE